jgi:hypothetical protein
MMLRLALSLCLACGLASAAEQTADQQSPDEFLNQPGMSLPETTLQALTNAIHPKGSEKNKPDFNFNFAQNLLAMQRDRTLLLGPAMSSVCSIPLVEMQIPKNTEFLIGRVTPTIHEADSMKAQMPAPPCEQPKTDHQ